MAIKPFINPGVAVAERPATISGAMNFISGGAPLGSSVVSAAANKIVGFQRGAAAVAPRAPDLGSIIKTLSTNILNNVENRVQSVNQNIQQFIQKNFQSQLGEYRDKLQSVDADQPSKILQNFLGLYEKAIGYMQFFANPRNVKQLGQNLRDLRNVFAETFEVAKNIRKTIVRIVGQLSNLPTASAGGGGINLDVDLPGAPLKKSGAPLRRRMGGAKGMLAAGGLGLGAGLVTSALAQPGSSQETTSGLMGSEGTVSQPLLEKFSAILDRFSSAISSLSKRKSETATSAPSAGGTATPAASPGGAPSAPGGTPVVSSGSAGENIASFVSTLEASGAQNQSDVMQVMVNRAAKNHLGYGDLFGQVTAREQFSPISAAIYNDSEDENAKKIYGPIAAKLGKTPQERIAKLKQLAEGPNGLENLRKLFGKGDPASAAKVLEDFKTQGVMSKTSARDIGGGLYFRGRGYTGGGVYFDRGSNKFIGGKGKGPATLAQVSGTSAASAVITKPSVTPAPTQQQVQQQTAQQVSRPAIMQSTPQTTVAPPITMGQQGARGIQKPPVTSAGKISGESSVPFLPTGNPDNFLTLYSKMVYNIVDG